MLGDIWTVFWRDWTVLRRRLWKFIFSRMITPVLYLVAFGWGLGRSVQVSPGQGSYLDFIVPGILALNSMNISFNAVGTPINMARLYHKTLEEYLVAPIRPISFVIGKLLAATLRGMMSSLVIVALAYAFGATFTVNGWFVLVLVLNCMIFAAMGFAAAMIIDTHEDMASFGTYVLLPMSFLCATFFSTDQLPQWIRWVLELLPLTHASYALRSIGTGGEPALISWLMLLAYLLGLSAVCVWTMERVRR